MPSTRSASAWGLWLLYLLVVPVAAAPLCGAGAQGGCHILPLVNLFDRVIQHSARMHGISNDLHTQLEQHFIPSRNHIGRVSRNCHTSSIPTPTGKENAQRMAREELTEVILKLLVAWREPLWHFHQSITHQNDFNLSTSRALEVSDMVHELRKGVEKVAEKMQMLGMIGNFVNGLTPPETLAPGDSSEWHLLKNYELIYCFRRDSNKVQNYLKILKCRIIPEYGC